MISFFKKKKSDQGVLSNLKTVTRWLQDLPAGDIYSAQETVVKHLIQFNHAEPIYSKDRLDVLMHLDESTRDMQSSLSLQYLRNARMSKTIESRLWVAIHAFYWEVTRSYHSFLMDFVANPGGSKIQPLIPLITARAIRGFADIIKWRYFRYEKVDEKLWLRMHNLYRIAEFDNFGGTEVMVYRSDSRKYSLAQEYGQALLLSLCGNGKMTPREIEMVDQWLDNWSDAIAIDTAFNPECHLFYADTGKGSGLSRCRNQVSDSALRFISTNGLLEHLQNAVEQLKSGTSPVSLGLTEDFRLPEGYKLIQLVENEWSELGTRERRSCPRVPSTGQWKIVRGLLNICTELEKKNVQTGLGPAQLSPEEILDIKFYGFVTERTKDRQNAFQRDFSTNPKHIIWEQADSSENGLGFYINETNNKWINVGDLLVLSPLENENWELGVVTRLARRDEYNRQVGIRSLSGTFQVITLKLDHGDARISYVVVESDHVSSEPEIKAILLTDDQDRESLIIDGASYARNRQYLLRIPFGPARLIRLESVEESGDAWLRVAFKDARAPVN